MIYQTAEQELVPHTYDGEGNIATFGKIRLKSPQGSEVTFSGETLHADCTANGVVATVSAMHTVLNQVFAGELSEGTTTIVLGTDGNPIEFSSER